MNSVTTGEGTGRIMNMKIICDEGVWQRCMHVWGVRSRAWQKWTCLGEREEHHRGESTMKERRGRDARVVVVECRGQ